MKRACVIIPVYKLELSSYEQISLSQCLLTLQAYDIFLVIPESLEKEIKGHENFAEHQFIYKTFKDEFFTNVAAYNKLLKYPGFYRSFLEYEFMLICQLDAFVFSDRLEDWCSMNFDTIGAPLFDGYDLAKKDAAIIGQGNGGFCLRKVRACYKVVSTFRRLNFKRTYEGPVAPLKTRLYRFLKHDLLLNFSGYPLQPPINEDIFWAELVPKVFKDFKVPKPTEAIGFSFEVNPDVLFEKNAGMLPFGCHAWWRYDLEFWRKHIEAYGYRL
jgi:hypothetical protein